MSRPASHVRAVRTGRRVPHPRPPPVLAMHHMALRPSSISLRVPLPSPPSSSLADGPDPESDLVRAAGPTVPRFLATVVTDPSFEFAAASALVAELVDFAAACRLDYAASLVAESESNCPPFVGGECALGTDVLEDRQEDFECFAAAVPHLVSMLIALEGDPDAPDIPTPRSCAKAITGPYSSQWQTAMDTEMASWKSTGTYVDAGPPSGANISMACGFSGAACTRRSSCAAHLASLGRFLQVPNGAFGGQSTVSARHLASGTDTLRMMLAALGYAPSTADPSLFLRTDTLLLPFYVLVYVDDLVFATADTEALALVKSKLQKRHTCTDLGELRKYLGLQIIHDRAQRTITLTQSHMVHQVLQRFSFRYSSPQSTPLPTGYSLSAPPSDESEAAKRVLRYFCSTSGMGLVLGGRGPVVSLDTQTLLGSSCESEIYVGAMAAQELRWLTYLLIDLGEGPQLQQRGQLRLAYVATRANTADIFTKALQSACFAFLDLSFAPFASVPVAPVARVPAASAATHHLLSSHGPSCSSLALSFLCCAGCSRSGGVMHMAIRACS
ncbi:unnamed protein product [Closterium sp. NIES-53]